MNTATLKAENDALRAQLKKVESALHKACEQLNFCVDPPKYTYSSDSETEERDDYCEYDRDNERIIFCGKPRKSSRWWGNEQHIL